MRHSQLTETARIGYTREALKRTRLPRFGRLEGRAAVVIEPQMYREMGLNDAEYQKVLGILGREPTLTELGMFAVMWSEHCGYKYSRPVLALFKTYKEAQEKGALENAGVIPLDEKLGIVFKIESHNHSSAVEPFQGAETGVGGIL